MDDESGIVAVLGKSAPKFGNGRHNFYGKNGDVHKYINKQKEYSLLFEKIVIYDLMGVSILSTRDPGA